MASSSSSAPLSSTSCSSSSAMSSMSSSSSSTRAAASSSPALADAAPAPAPAPGRVDDASFPALGTAPPRPPTSGRAAPPPRCTASAGRQRRRKTTRIVDIRLPPSLYGRRGVAAEETLATVEERDAPSETSATAEAGDAEPRKTSATAEAGDADPVKTSATAEAGDAEPRKTSAGDAELGTTSTAAAAAAAEEIAATATEEIAATAAEEIAPTAEELDAELGTTSTAAATVSVRPPFRAAPGRIAAASAVLPGAPPLPAAQAFAFGDLFRDLRRSRSPTPRAATAAAAAAPPQPPPLQVARFPGLVPLQGSPPPPPQPPRFLDLVPLQGSPPPLQVPRHFDRAPRDLVPLQGPPPQFAPPVHAHYPSAMQIAARPQHMRVHVYAPGRPMMFVDVHWHFQATPPPFFFEPRPRYGFTSTLALLPCHPQGPLLRAYPPMPPVGHVGCLCWDCQARTAMVPFACGHFFLCRECITRRLWCPCCTAGFPSLEYLSDETRSQG